MSVGKGLLESSKGGRVGREGRRVTMFTVHFMRKLEFKLLCIYDRVGANLCKFSFCFSTQHPIVKDSPACPPPLSPKCWDCMHHHTQFL